MPLFRRKREDPETGAPPPAPKPPASPGRLGGRRKNAPPAAPVVAPAPDGAAPPPLPAPPAAPAPTLDVRPDYSECFVCGTTLEGKTCPTCRMTWVE